MPPERSPPDPGRVLALLDVLERELQQLSAPDSVQAEAAMSIAELRAICTAWSDTQDDEQLRTKAGSFIKRLLVLGSTELLIELLKRL